MEHPLTQHAPAQAWHHAQRHRHGIPTATAAANDPDTAQPDTAELTSATVFLLGALGNYLALTAAPAAQRDTALPPLHQQRILREISARLRSEPGVTPTAAAAALLVVTDALHGRDTLAHHDRRAPPRDPTGPGDQPASDTLAMLAALADLADLIDALHNQPGAAHHILEPLLHP